MVSQWGACASVSSFSAVLTCSRGLRGASVRVVVVVVGMR